MLPPLKCTCSSRFTNYLDIKICLADFFSAIGDSSPALAQSLHSAETIRAMTKTALISVSNAPEQGACVVPSKYLICSTWWQT